MRINSSSLHQNPRPVWNENVSIDSRGSLPEQRAASEIERQWEPCRNYLLLVANRELNGELRAKVSPSDVVQETFLEAQKHFDQFRGSSQEELLAWLSSILHSLLRNASRRYKETQKRDVSREVRVIIIPVVGVRAEVVNRMT